MIPPQHSVDYKIFASNYDPNSKIQEIDEKYDLVYRNMVQILTKYQTPLFGLSLPKLLTLPPKSGLELVEEYDGLLNNIKQTYNIIFSSYLKDSKFIEYIILYKSLLITIEDTDEDISNYILKNKFEDFTIGKMTEGLIQNIKGTDLNNVELICKELNNNIDTEKNRLLLEKLKIYSDIINNMGTIDNLDEYSVLGLHAGVIEFLECVIYINNIKHIIVYDEWIKALNTLDTDVYKKYLYQKEYKQLYDDAINLIKTSTNEYRRKILQESTEKYMDIPNIHKVNEIYSTFNESDYLIIKQILNDIKRFENENESSLTQIFTQFKKHTDDKLKILNILSRYYNITYNNKGKNRKWAINTLDTLITYLDEQILKYKEVIETIRQKIHTADNADDINNYYRANIHIIAKLQGLNIELKDTPNMESLLNTMNTIIMSNLESKKEKFNLISSTILDRFNSRNINEETNVKEYLQLIDEFAKLKDQFNESDGMSELITENTNKISVNTDDIISKLININKITYSSKDDLFRILNLPLSPTSPESSEVITALLNHGRTYISELESEIKLTIEQDYPWLNEKITQVRQKIMDLLNLREFYNTYPIDILPYKNLRIELDEYYKLNNNNLLLSTTFDEIYENKDTYRKLFNHLKNLDHFIKPYIDYILNEHKIWDNTIDKLSNVSYEESANRFTITGRSFQNFRDFSNFIIEGIEQATRYKDSIQKAIKFITERLLNFESNAGNISQNISKCETYFNKDILDTSEIKFIFQENIDSVNKILSNFEKIKIYFSNKPNYNLYNKFRELINEPNKPPSLLTNDNIIDPINDADYDKFILWNKNLKIIFSQDTQSGINLIFSNAFPKNTMPIFDFINKPSNRTKVLPYYQIIENFDKPGDYNLQTMILQFDGYPQIDTESLSGFPLKESERELLSEYNLTIKKISDTDNLVDLFEIIKNFRNSRNVEALKIVIMTVINTKTINIIYEEFLNHITYNEDILNLENIVNFKLFNDNLLEFINKYKTSGSLNLNGDIKQNGNKIKDNTTFRFDQVCYTSVDLADSYISIINNAIKEFNRANATHTESEGRILPLGIINWGYYLIYIICYHYKFKTNTFPSNESIRYIIKLIIQDDNPIIIKGNPIIQTTPTKSVADWSNEYYDSYHDDMPDEKFNIYKLKLLYFTGIVTQRFCNKVKTSHHPGISTAIFENSNLYEALLSINTIKDVTFLANMLFSSVYFKFGDCISYVESIVQNNTVQAGVIIDSIIKKSLKRNESLIFIKYKINDNTYWDAISRKNNISIYISSKILLENFTNRNEYEHIIEVITYWYSICTRPLTGTGATNTDMASHRKIGINTFHLLIYLLIKEKGNVHKVFTSPEYNRSKLINGQVILDFHLKSRETGYALSSVSLRPNGVFPSLLHDNLTIGGMKKVLLYGPNHKSKYGHIDLCDCTENIFINHLREIIKNTNPAFTYSPTEKFNDKVVSPPGVMNADTYYHIILRCANFRKNNSDYDLRIVNTDCQEELGKVKVPELLNKDDANPSYKYDFISKINEDPFYSYLANSLDNFIPYILIPTTDNPIVNLFNIIKHSYLLHEHYTARTDIFEGGKTNINTYKNYVKRNENKIQKQILESLITYLKDSTGKTDSEEIISLISKNPNYYLTDISNDKLDIPYNKLYGNIAAFL